MTQPERSGVLYEAMGTTKVQEKLLQVYDYIIIGAGSTGGIIAARLSEDAEKSVLVLEAGADDLENPDIAVPGKCGSLCESEYNWGYESVPQKEAFKGYVEQRSVIARGKGLGGTGAINYMVYMRGTPHDFDTWENMGCSGWSYRDVLPYFIKSEGCLDQRLLDNGYHGANGPTLVSESKYSPLSDLFFEACKELGFRETDCNGNDPIGFMRTQSNIGDGVRQSSAESYLRPASHRENLHIATHCHVTKIVIDNEVARAVEFVRKGEKQLVRSRREIILSAGAIGSPQILMLSGIGPKEHLQSLGIPVVADLPVGDNYQDHVTAWGTEFSIDPQNFPKTSEKEFDKLYKTLRAGPLGTSISEAMAYVRSDLQDPGNPNPDFFFFFGSVRLGSSGDNMYQRLMGMTDQVWSTVFSGLDQPEGFLVNPTLSHPKSRGTVRLSSRDPFAPPLIDPNALSHPDDVKVLAVGLKIARSLVETEACKAAGVKLSDRVIPGYHGTPFTDEYWEEHARTLTWNTDHPCGSCRMGRLRDSTTVVDPQLRVKVVERLQVADASIMPEITSANLNAVCIMIGEKAADITKSECIACV